jgi:hypothetical protein
MCWAVNYKTRNKPPTNRLFKAKFSSFISVLSSKQVMSSYRFAEKPFDFNGAGVGGIRI